MKSYFYHDWFLILHRKQYFCCAVQRRWRGDLSPYFLGALHCRCYTQRADNLSILKDIPFSTRFGLTFNCVDETVDIFLVISLYYIDCFNIYFSNWDSELVITYSKWESCTSVEFKCLKKSIASKRDDDDIPTTGTIPDSIFSSLFFSLPFTGTTDLLPLVLHWPSGIGLKYLLHQIVILLSITS